MAENEKKDIYVEKEPEIARLKKIVNAIRKGSLFCMPLIVLFYLLFYVWLDVSFVWRFFRPLVVFLPVVVWYFTFAIKVVYDWERLVVFRFGEYQRTKSPGLRSVFKPIERQIFVKMWENRTDLKPQNVLVMEEVPGEDGKIERVPINVKVNAIFYYKVDNRTIAEIRAERLKKLDKELAKIEKEFKKAKDVEIKQSIEERKKELEETRDLLKEKEKEAKKTGREDKFDDPAYKSITKVKDVDGAILQLVETFLRAISAHYDIEGLMRDRREISNELKSIVEEEAKDWGIIITKGELQYVDPPEDILKAFRSIIIADKDRKSVVIKSEGEAKAVENVYVAIRTNDSEGFHITNFKTLQDMSKNPATLIVPAKGLDVLSAAAAVAGKAFKKGSLTEGEGA